MRWLLPLLLLLGSSGASASRPQPQARIDSLKRALIITTDTARVKVLYELAKLTYSNDFTQAEQYTQAVLRESTRLGWRYGQARGLELTGRLYWRQGNLASGQQNLLAALAIWREMGKPRQAARVAFHLSELLTGIKQYKRAAQWGNQALQGAQASHDTVAIMQAYMALGDIISAQDKHREARAHYMRAVALVQGRYLRPKSNESVTLATVLNNLADSYILTAQPKLALPYLFKAIKMNRDSENKVDAAYVECTIAQAYGAMGKASMAIYHAHNARQLGIESKTSSLQIIVNDLLDTLYAQQGNYRLARKYGAENRVLEAQMRQQEQEGKVAEMQGRYDTKEKERNIQLLTQQNQIARLSALQQRTLRNAAFVTAGLLLLAVGILLNRYLLRQRTVRQLNEQKQALEIRDQEKEVLLREKTLLLQEVHHRVKNNLQIVLSLLNTQVNTLHEPLAIRAIRDSQSRVQTMALIHQNLYQSESLARIDMARYFTELTEAIVRAYRTEAAAVQLTLDIAPLQLTTHTAVPLGLIVNELVTNALKYAFPVNQPTKYAKYVRVHLSQTTVDTYQLVVADNGVGLPAALEPAQVASLGLRLVTGLAQQMKAELTVESVEGAKFTLTFREVPPSAARP